MGNLLDRKALLTKEKLEVVKVDLGKNEFVYVKQMTGRERDNFEQSILKKNKDSKGVVIGFETITEVKELSMSTVYDFEVLHKEHRYYPSSGFCSHNTGKTFLALNAAREAQAMGYHVIYGDSESAVDQDLVEKFGIDPNNLRYQPFKTALHVRHFVSNLCHELRIQRDKKMELPKIMFIIDSLGNLGTEKERADALSGSEKRDMTKQQNLRSLFRVITMELAEFKIPTLMTNHTYACLVPETLVITESGTKEIKDVKKGEMILTVMGFRPVEEVYSYDNVETLRLEFEDGTHEECSDEHKWMVKNLDSSYSWKFTDELKENDEILQLEPHELKILIENEEVGMIYRKKWQYHNDELISVNV